MAHTKRKADDVFSAPEAVEPDFSGQTHTAKRAHLDDHAAANSASGPPWQGLSSAPDSYQGQPQSWSDQFSGLGGSCSDTSPARTSHTSASDRSDISQTYFSSPAVPAAVTGAAVSPWQTASASSYSGALVPYKGIEGDMLF
ncbi:hypothetical protein WJX84_000113 [Apatococcus fuscideae]|uniref:Uncharacterized protein n=1 Tax=Apatococcus fuscideae TaxID=2026836 RepID=A0AAW1TFR6_9CHLO